MIKNSLIYDLHCSLSWKLPQEELVQENDGRIRRKATWKDCDEGNTEEEQFNVDDEGEDDNNNDDVDDDDDNEDDDNEDDDNEDDEDDDEVHEADDNEDDLNDESSGSNDEGEKEVKNSKKKRARKSSRTRPNKAMVRLICVA